MLREVHFELSQGIARVWSTLTRLFGVEGSECAWQRAFRSRWAGWARSAVRTSTAAYWSSWADTKSMIRARRPAVADDMVITLSATGKVSTCKERTLDDDVCKMQASMLQNGEICPEDCAPANEELTRPQSQELHAMGGNGSRHKKLTLLSSQELCGQD